MPVILAFLLFSVQDCAPTLSYASKSDSKFCDENAPPPTSAVVLQSLLALTTLGDVGASVVDSCGRPLPLAAGAAPVAYTTQTLPTTSRV
jgi:hypothetical protein